MKEHTKMYTVHDAKLEFQSASSSNIKSLFADPALKIAKILSKRGKSQKSSRLTSRIANKH